MPGSPEASRLSLSSSAMPWPCRLHTVRNVGSTSHGAYEITELELALDGAYATDTHTVWHYWYTAWPDHGVPTNAAGEFDSSHLLTMMRAVRKKRALADKKATPLVIHCSAGVGRTGTLIVIDHMISAIRYKDPIDVIKVVASRLRFAECNGVAETQPCCCKRAREGVSSVHRKPCAGLAAQL